jgi:hypothetical protein
MFYKPGKSFLISILILFLSTLQPLNAYVEYNGTMADFIGANQNVDISDKNYYSQYRIPFKWLRDYVGWSWLQDDLTLFGWNGEGYSGGWPNHQDFYQNLNSYGINVLMCVMNGNENGSLDT